jgi:cytochrome c553
MSIRNPRSRARFATQAIALVAIAWAFAPAVVFGGEAAPAAATTPEGIEYFERHVRPLFAQNCLKCHGEKQQGGLRLDSRSTALAGGDSGPAIAAGNPQASLLMQAVHYKDEIKMPPDGKLAPEAILAIETWIKMGAPWPAESASAAPAKAADAWKTHWALQPVTKPALPVVVRGAWPRSPLDFFVLSKLEERGLAPSEPAARRILIRRATLDLTGLPPEAAEIDTFVADQSPGAFDRVVERLLASPHYGERWGRHWLDVARYADTKGYLFTQDRNYPNAYRYRDWVVRALNEDLPYDQFLIQQIAADRLAPAADAPSLAAMGFLTVGRRFLGNPHDIIDDRLDVLTRGTMALTVTCARCHDHKYDPIPTKDYYSLYGVLASSVEPAQPADVMTLADAERPVVPHVFVRGNPGNPGESVPRQFLGVLSGENRQPFGSGSGRLELARAIASRDNPLTARVIVNRIWLHYFENPLVRTPSDFGLRSEPPSHPELLDFLAASLVEHNWSLKDLHRLILKSATYQQASADRAECRKADSENRYLWRMNRKRLDFESLRDGLLAAAGQLDRSLGGPAVELTKTPWSRRRTLYGLIDRQNLPSLFRTFDFASPDTHSPGRFTTTVPQQALYMMNSPFLAEMVRSLANQRELVGTSEPRERIDRVYRLGLGRPPATQEVDLGLAFLAEEDARDKRAPVTGSPQPAAQPAAATLSAWERYVQVVLLSNEFMFID